MLGTMHRGRTGGVPDRARKTCLWLISALPLGACTEFAQHAEAVRQVNEGLSRENVTQAPVQQIAADPTTSPFLTPAPDVFEATGLAMWDGRQTLQGIWVAHPDARSARRVRIANPETGRAVDGALFRRDESLTGPPVLISSEAANALGLRPGFPVELEITALRPLAAEERAETSEAPADDAAETTKVATPASEAENNQDVAAAEPTAPAEESAGSAPERNEDTTQPAETEKPKEIEVAAAPATAETPPAAKPEPDAQPESEAAPKQEAAQVAETTAPAPTAPERAAPAEDPAPAAEVAAAAPPPSKPARPLARPFLQAGTFGVPENATGLVARLKRQGIPAKSQSFTSSGKTFARVVAGPFANAGERRAALRALRKLGITDAVPVRR